MDPPPPHPAHRLHLHLDPRHHHRIHINLCHHATHAPSVHHDHHQTPVPPRSLPDALPPPAHAAAPGWHAPQQGGEAAMDPDEASDVEVEEEEEPVFVLTDEWAEFFARADAKRRLAKQQKKRKNSSRNK